MTIMEELIIPIRESIVATGGVDNKEVFREHNEVFKQVKARDAEGAGVSMVKSLKHSRLLLEKKGKKQGDRQGCLFFIDKYDAR